MPNYPKTSPRNYTTKAMVFLGFLFALTTNILPITIKSSLNVNPTSKKTIILLNEVHDEPIKKSAQAEEAETHDKLYQAQKKTLTDFAHSIIRFDEKKGAETVIITETNNNLFCSLFEQEAGATQVKENTDTLETLPRLFLQHILATGTSVDSKIEILKNKIQPFNALPSASFLLDNRVRWIAGDRLRTKMDTDLAFTVYTHWDKIKAALKAQEELPDHLKELTIGNVKKYIDKLHAQFEEQSIIDPYFQKIVDLITRTLTTSTLSESDHLAFLHEHLLMKGENELRDEFNNNLISFVSQKFDAELFKYIEAFEKDEKLNYLVIEAGSEHNRLIGERLSSKGYITTKKAGVEDDTLVLSCFKQRTLSILFEALKSNPPFISMEEFIDPK